MKDLFGILVTASINVINHAILENIWIINIVKCRKRIIDILFEECSENIDGNEMLYNETLDVIPLNVYRKVCSSCMVYIVLFVVFLITSICVFIYFYWYLKKDNISTNFNVGYLNI